MLDLGDLFFLSLSSFFMVVLGSKVAQSEGCAASCQKVIDSNPTLAPSSLLFVLVL